jgi:hypothetical protein
LKNMAGNQLRRGLQEFPLFRNFHFRNFHLPEGTPLVTMHKSLNFVFGPGIELVA